jgi:predicted permease
LGEVAKEMIDIKIILAITFLVLAVIFGWLTWIARNAWRDRRKAQAFALVAAVSTLLFMVVGYLLIP